MLRRDEAAALLEPLDVDLIRDIVLDPNDRDQNEAEHEREAHEIVGVFGGLRERAKGVRSDQRQQQLLPEGDVEPGQAQNDERHRRQPMHEPLERAEAQDLASGSPFRDADPSEDE